MKQYEHGGTVEQWNGGTVEQWNGLNRHLFCSITPTKARDNIQYLLFSRTKSTRQRPVFSNKSPEKARDNIQYFVVFSNKSPEKARDNICCLFRAQ
jgi:hypothetical protein